MYKCLFTTNGFEHPHIGYTTGTRWNGWATPYFEVDEALAIMQEFNADNPDEPMLYAEANDTFMHKIADDEIELWRGRNYETAEGIKHLYGIGAYSWVWELTTQDDIYAVAQGIEDLLWELDSYEYCNQYDSRKEVLKEIIAQLQDFKTLKQALMYLYTEELTEQELYDKLGGILKI